MSNVLLFGGSSEAIMLLRDLGFSIIAIVDPDVDKSFPNYQVLRSDIEAVAHFPDCPIAVSVDDCNDRARVFKFIFDAGAECINLLGGTIHSAAAYGLFMQKNSFISADVLLGRGVRLNYGATVMHDCVLEDFVTVAPCATLLGGVKVGELSYIGAGATILPYLNIGKGCVIGAGAVVTKDVANGTSVKGVPAC